MTPKFDSATVFTHNITWSSVQPLKWTDLAIPFQLNESTAEESRFLGGFQNIIPEKMGPTPRDEPCH